MKPPYIRSGRDSEKARGQARVLAWPTGKKRSQSYNLVVCAADKIKDSWIFSDFMGLCMSLMEQNVKGDFLSCFPVRSYFAVESYDTIKFGTFGASRTEYVHKYSREQFERGQIWWRDVKASEVLGKIQRWINHNQNLSQSGDVVNIFFGGHGDQKLGFACGNGFLHQAVLGQMLAHYRPGVQVNFVPNFCFSGLFVEALRSNDIANCHAVASCSPMELSWSQSRSASGRYRSVRFAKAFLQSLSHIPKPPDSVPSWTIHEHESFLLQ
ncbi:hypothetical protein N7495_001278 [Penicillium taxi]|uniref:uncharacterized protein n=1 Tax=Penicillium taxi TaxID=168475 RepID=UPI00254501B8|nr:uncharacterized protein N7495_001278 [Penicillium taxi]KAJ5908596.1 hypothetical protein N7495_001278 [Penicillium taxi]